MAAPDSAAPPVFCQSSVFASPDYFDSGGDADRRERERGAGRVVGPRQCRCARLHRFCRRRGRIRATAPTGICGAPSRTARKVRCRFRRRQPRMSVAAIGSTRARTECLAGLISPIFFDGMRTGPTQSPPIIGGPVGWMPGSAPAARATSSQSLCRCTECGFCLALRLRIRLLEVNGWGLSAGRREGRSRTACIRAGRASRSSGSTRQSWPRPSASRADRAPKAPRRSAGCRA